MLQIHAIALRQGIFHIFTIAARRRGLSYPISHTHPFCSPFPTPLPNPPLQSITTPNRTNHGILRSLTGQTLLTPTIPLFSGYNK